MKTNKLVFSIATILSLAVSVNAQEKNLVMNGSFENLSGTVRSTGGYILADSISSSNNTTVDLYSKSACGDDLHVPTSYMGVQEPKTGNNYAGIIAYYADDAGFFKTKPGYRKYSEYVQLNFSQPLEAGKAYSLTFNVSLAERSAYAVSGLGVYFSKEKMDVKNNAFLDVMPHVVCTEVLSSTEWTTVTGTYVAAGGERYLTLGCFDNYMKTQKVAKPNTNDSRKAYYFIDDVGMTLELINMKDLTSILTGSCYQLNDLNFETDKAVILADSFEELKSLSRFLKTYPYIVVYIDGHTDKTGTDAHNDKLSQDRAAAVKLFLVNDGVNASRMKARGYGENQPIDTEKDKSFVNRRVEITICAVIQN